jgi:hypothetical protein
MVGICTPRFATVRLECLGRHWFLDLDDAREKVEEWHQECRLRLAKEPARTRWSAAAGADLPPHSRDEIVFGREGRLGTWTIRITAIGYQDNGHR